jgi:hypothetical protein
LELNHINELFNDSFERCMKDSDFLDRFFDIFMSMSDDIRLMFEVVDMERQKKMILLGLPIMMVAHNDNHALDHYTKKLFKMGIPSHVYPVWLESMIEAVKICDKRFDEQIEKSWRHLLAPGINYIMREYNRLSRTE